MGSTAAVTERNIAQFSADVHGNIELNTITFNVGNSGFDTTSGSNFAVINPILRVGGSQVSGSNCTTDGTSIVTCSFGSGYSSDYPISAGSAVTFGLFATVNGSVNTSAIAAVSSTVTPAGFIWDDASTNGVSGTGFNGNLIFGFPTNSYTNHQ